MSHVVVPWFLLECGFSHDQPRTGTWIARSGIRLLAYGKHGAPFGRARVIWLCLATRASRSGSTVELSLSEMARTFGGKVRTFKEHLHRLAECYYELPAGRESASDGQTRRPFFEIVNVQGRAVTVALYADFMRSARAGILCPLDDVVRFVRANQLAALDLHLWYLWRAHRGHVESVNAFGPEGPFALLPISDDPDKRRADLRKRHAAVLDLASSCRFGLDGDRIVHTGDGDGAAAVHRVSAVEPEHRTAPAAVANAPARSASVAKSRSSPRSSPGPGPARSASVAKSRSSSGPGPARSASVAKSRSSSGRPSPAGQRAARSSPGQTRPSRRYPSAKRPSPPQRRQARVRELRTVDDVSGAIADLHAQLEEMMRPIRDFQRERDSRWRSKK